MTYEVIQDLVPDNLDHLKRLLGRHRVDQHVAMDSDRVPRVQNAVFILQQFPSASKLMQLLVGRLGSYLTGGIYNLGRIFLALKLNGP